MTTIISKSGTGIPASDQLETAELAVDTSNGDLYTKLSDDTVVQINGGSGSGGVEEAPIDTKQYARQDAGWSEVVIPDGGAGSSVHIGETPPDNPEEGQQWMEVPASGDATMWIYDSGNGGQWLQHPSGGGGSDIDTSQFVLITGDQEIDGVKTFTQDIVGKANVYGYFGSDERLKDEISSMPIGLIDAVIPCVWKWKSDGRSSGGVIAQQLQKIGLDDWVREAPNGDLGVDSMALIGMLIAEVQDLKRRLSDG